MKRRDFITLLGAASAWPLAARAQQARRIPRIGVLWHADSPDEEGSNFTALVKGFSDLGYIDGRTIILEHRFPNEMPDRFRSMAAELVASGVDVLIGVGANAAPYAKNATTTIPVVFVLVSDPIGSGLVKSLARPEGNVTGISNYAADLVGKRLELFKEIIPISPALRCSSMPMRKSLPSTRTRLRRRRPSSAYSAARISGARPTNWCPPSMQ
jgi:putative tryptophan/tyrosine transport system substrate-binding protein